MNYNYMYMEWNGSLFVKVIFVQPENITNIGNLSLELSLPTGRFLFGRLLIFNKTLNTEFFFFNQINKLFPKM